MASARAWSAAGVAALVLGVRYWWLTLLALRGAWWLAAAVLQILVLLVGSGSFWWLLRSFQLQMEQELLDQALVKYKYYSRYRHRAGSHRAGSHSAAAVAAAAASVSGSGGGEYASTTTTPPTADAHGGCMTDAGFQLRVMKRMPIAAHLRTSWSLPRELCDEIAALVQLAVRDYVSFWFQPVSPNEDFPHDVKFLLADLLGAMASRVLEVDSSQALTMLAKSLELLRLHLGWFREAYAQLADEYPSVFEGDENDANLLKRQEYVAAFVQRSPFIHPGCVASVPSAQATANSGSGSGSNSGRKSAGDGAEAVYLRHVATQLLTQLKPQLGQQHDTNVFVSIAMNLLRETTAFKILKPLTEYAQPQFANELVLACLGVLLDDKDGSGPLSPTSAASGGSTSGGMMPTMSLNKLRLTSSFLYKASKRSGEQAEAAFQAVVDAVATAASSAAAGASEAAAFDGDDWTDPSSAFAFGSAVFAANAMGDKKSASASLLAADDHRLGVAKAARLMNPRGFIPGGLLSHKSSNGSSTGNGDGGGGGRRSAHMDELKAAKTNLGSSLNSSLGKVGRGVRQAGARLRTLNTHPMDQLSAPQFGSGSLSSTSAARMIRKPGQLLQKAWKRNDSGVGGPASPGAAFEAPLPDDGGGGRGRSKARTAEAMNPLRSPAGDDEDDEDDGRLRAPSDAAKLATMRERVVVHVDKAVANYAKMHAERPELRSSARSRELYELLSALEDAFMLGYHQRDAKASSSEEDAHEDGGAGPDTPPVSPSGRVRRPSLPANAEELLLLSPTASSGWRSFGTERDSDVDDDTEEDEQYYWAYLAQHRADEPELNAHAVFVGSRCPACSSSDAFVSTRGVQWMLAAMEKRRLGAFVAALASHADVTELFYESYAVLRDASLVASVLRHVAQLDALHVSLDVPRLVGRASELEHELGGLLGSSPRRSRSVSSPQSAVRVLEKVWETERYVPMHGWAKASDKRGEALPSSEWVWEDDWALEAAGGNDTGESSDGEAASMAWEYAKTFEDRFHAKEKKFDAVRRRCWVRRRRQLPPVLSLPSSPASTSSSLSAAALVNSLGKARKLKQRVDALKKDKLASGAALKRALLRRRSKSFDKESPGSPLEGLTLSMLECDVADADADADAARATAETSTKSAPSRRRTRVSMPSLRRGSSNPKSRKSSSGDAEPPLAVRESLTEDAAPGDDKDGDDEDGDDEDEKLCFRCLQPLTACGPGVGACQNCHQRVCASCHAFFAFLVFPPPLETSKKARVCGNCYDRLASRYKLRIEAHVGTYLIKERERERERERESPDRSGGVSSSHSSNHSSNHSSSRSSSSATAACTSPSSPSSPSGTSDVGSPTGSGDAGALSPAGSRAAKFEVTVKLKDESAYAWSVVKSFQEFQALEKQLRERLRKQEKKFGAGCRACHWRGVDYTEVAAVTPSLSSLPSSAAAALSYEQRLQLLEAFLQQLLASDTLCQSSVVQKFLLLANASSRAPGSASASGWDAGESAAGLATASSCGAGGPSSSNGLAASGLLMEHGKWRKGRWVAPDANSKETKMRVLQKIEVSLFSVLGELLELDGIGLVRRQLLSMTRSFIKAFLGASHFRMLERQFLSFTDPKKLSAWIADLRDVLFPDPSDEPPPPRDTPLPAADMQALRKDCLEAILASFPARALSLFGDTACQNAALKLHEFLQHELFVKNLLFSITDELLLHLFPDSSVFQPKKASSSAVAACPPPSTDGPTPTGAAAVTPPSSPPALKHSIVI